MKQRSDGSFVAAPIWRAFLDAVLKGKPAEAFGQPQPTPGDLAPVLRGEDPGRIRVRVDRTTGKRATDQTPAELVEEREYRTLHTILHTIRREDPRGPAPEHPEEDPMYRPWEDALASWAQRNHIETSPPPTEVDDVHTEANRPTLTVSQPTTTTTVEGRDVLVEGMATAPRGVARMEVRIGDIAASLFAPSSDGGFRQTVRLPAIVGRGSHDLVVSAFDDAGNRRDATVSITVTSDRESITVAWEQPAAASVLRAADFPATLMLRATTATGANRLEILIADADGERLLTNVTPPSSGPIRILWPSPPPAGAVTLRARLLTGDTLIAETEPLRLTIER